MYKEVHCLTLKNQNQSAMEMFFFHEEKNPKEKKNRPKQLNGFVKGSIYANLYVNSNKLCEHDRIMRQLQTKRVRF